MSLDRTAKGIVLVPSLLLGGAFLAAAAWLDGPAAENRGLAIALGCTLMAVGLLAQWLPEGRPGGAGPAAGHDDPEGTPGEPDAGG